MQEQELRRLSDCEVLIGKYHDQLQKFMDQVVNYNNQVIQKNDFDKALDNLQKSWNYELNVTRTDASDNYTLHADLEKKVEDISKLANSHHDMINKHGAIIEKMGLSVQSFETHFASHEKKLAILNAKMPNWEKISLEYEEFKRNMFNLLGVQGEKMDSFKEQVQNLTLTLQRETNRIRAIESEEPEKEAKAAEVRSQIYDRMDEIRLSIDTKVSQVKSEMLSQMEQIKLPVELPKPTEPVVVPDELKSKVDSLVMDVANAKAKSDVNEMQLKIFEKKLDNIYLLLKKNELTQ